MSKEIQRQAVKNILQEMSDNTEPAKKIMLQAIEEEWSEAQTAKAIIESTDMTKTFDYYTGRIVSIFYESARSELEL